MTSTDGNHSTDGTQRAGTAPHWLQHRYGPHPAQVADLALPPAVQGPAPAGPAPVGRVPAGRVPVAITLHGGYWRARYDRTLQHPVAADLLAAGWAVWNVDYRAVGAGPNDGGGWPASYLDVAAGIDALAGTAGRYRLDLDAVVVIGHSAGGALALWAAGRHRLPAGAPGAVPRVRPAAVIAQAAICDLVAGALAGLGAGAIVELMGAHPDAAAPGYGLASPAALLPLGVPVLLVHGSQDDTVPPSQSIAFAEAARAAGDDVTLELLPGEGHFGHLDPGSPSWAPVRRRLAAYRVVVTGIADELPGS